MRRDNRWKTMIQYTAGIVTLALCVAAAMFLPEQYARWTDAKEQGKVTLSKRETIDFLNAEQLDIEERLQMISNAEDFSFMEMPMFSFTSEEEELRKWERLIGKWCDVGLLPVQCEEMIPELGKEEMTLEVEVYQIGWVGMYNNYTEQTTIPMFLVGISDMDGNLLSFVMDAEAELLYFAAINGRIAVDQIAAELGYGSGDELEAYLIGHDGMIDPPEVAARSVDFASAFGAKSAQVQQEPDQIEMTASLTFETFEAEAQRALVIDAEANLGLAVTYGTKGGELFMNQLFELFGYQETVCSTGELLDLLRMQEAEGMWSSGSEEMYADGMQYGTDGTQYGVWGG